MDKLNEDEWIKEGNIILVQINKGISEVMVADLSPSGKYMKVTTRLGNNPIWINTIHHLETIESDDNEEWEDVAGDEEDLIGDEWKVSIVEPEPEEAEVITQNTLAEFDKRNTRT